MSCPSGDHDGEPSGPSFVVRRRSAPESDGIRKMSVLLLQLASRAVVFVRFDVNAIHRPSGDHVGPLLSVVPVVSWRFFFAATSYTHTCVYVSFCSA